MLREEVAINAFMQARDCINLNKIGLVLYIFRLKFILSVLHLKSD